MSTGLFSAPRRRDLGEKARAHRQDVRASARAKGSQTNAVKFAARLETFAEYLAEDEEFGDVRKAAARMNMSAMAGYRMLRRLCEGLGKQAI